MSENTHLTFDASTFANGDRGHLHPQQGRPKLTNMRMTRSGLLCVRPGWGSRSGGPDATFPLMPAVAYDSYSVSPVTSGVVWANYTGASGHYVGFTNRSGTSYTESYAGAGFAFGFESNLSHMARISPFEFILDARVIITVGTSSVSLSNDLYTNMAATFGLGDLTVPGYSVVHQGRGFYFGPPSYNGLTPWTNRGRVYYSDPYAYDAFDSASQYFDMDGSVVGGVSLGSTLYFWNTDGDWYSLTGRGDPSLGTLTKLSQGQRIPQSNAEWTVVDGLMFFVSTDDTVCMFDGTVDDKTLRHLDVAEYSRLGSSSVVNTIVSESISFAEGVWVADESSAVGDTYAYTTDVMPISGLNYDVAAGNLVWYDRVANPEGISSDRGESGMTGTVVLPRISDPEKRVRIRKVVVDFIVDPSVGTPDGDVTISSASGDTSLTEGPTNGLFSGLSGSEQYRRLVWTGMPSYEDYYDVKLENLRHLGIVQVDVWVERSQGLIT